ncbi:MAG TPA: LPS export ABC transporter periplasmic protein LptC [Kiloniellaceae bacterium]|nr:LPS export ABC transporter periplasmic protein LptC [Kiloniellaceae bacterium]
MTDLPAATRPSAPRGDAGSGGGGSGPHAAGRQPPRLSQRNHYSVFVHWMKFLLPALACALILLVVAWPQIAPDEKLFQVEPIKNAAQEAQNLNMINARFSGFDDKEQPFTVTADMATQRPGEKDRVELQRPKADITLQDGTWLALTAKVGYYDRETELLDLVGAVNLFHDEGFEVRTEKAQVDLKNGVASGNVPVESQGPSGTLTSEGFRILDKGDIVIFTGKSKLVLYPEEKGPSE